MSRLGSPLGADLLGPADEIGGGGAEYVGEEGNRLQRWGAQPALDATEIGPVPPGLVCERLLGQVDPRASLTHGLAERLLQRDLTARHSAHCDVSPYFARQHICYRTPTLLSE